MRSSRLISASRTALPSNEALTALISASRTTVLPSAEELTALRKMLIKRVLIRAVDRGSLVTMASGAFTGFVGMLIGSALMILTAPAAILSKDSSWWWELWWKSIGFMAMMPGGLVGLIPAFPRMIQLYFNRTFRYGNRQATLFCDGLRQRLSEHDGKSVFLTLRGTIITQYGNVRWATAESKELIGTLNNPFCNHTRQASAVINYLTEIETPWVSFGSEMCIWMMCFRLNSNSDSFLNCSLPKNQGKRLFNTIMDVLVNSEQSLIPEEDNPWKKRNIGLMLLALLEPIKNITEESRKKNYGRKFIPDTLTTIGAFLFSNTIGDTALRVHRDVKDICALKRMYVKNTWFCNTATKDIFRKGENYKTAVARMEIEATKYPGKASAKTLAELSNEQEEMIPREGLRQKQ